ncbi:MAG: type IV secretion system DNA-binding domain-containing protein [Pseudorhodoplanes sp.]|nr:type IV secretion system DNA-binding domain-containing protein [Pseudorhodoplanes sp.]
MIILGPKSEHESVALEAAERRRHLYIVGQTGTGKSTLLLNLLAQDLSAGEGLALLDPHGDLAEATLAAIPKARSNDLVYVAPADASHPIGFNPLSRVPDALKPVVADGIVAAFRHVWPESWGPRLDYILTNAVRALLDVPGATLLMLPRLLIDDTFRAPLIERHVRDPMVRAYWRNEYAGYSDSFRNEAIAPIQNKIGKALMVPSLRNMLAQPKSSITMRRLMDESAIVICNLAKGQLGESTSHLIGALIVTAFAQAALSRADAPVERRTVFHLYADEFQSFATESFALILSEARKYGLTLTVGHQYLDQLSPALQAAVFGNVGSIVACRVGASDAAALAAQIGLGGPQALLDLPNFAAWTRLLRRGVPTSPIRFDLAPAPPPLPTDPRRLIALSRARFGVPRAEVEARIERFLGL